MNIRKYTLFVSLLLLLATLFTLTFTVTATHVAPVFVAGNPSCTDLGYTYGFKPQPEPPPSGTYNFPGDPVNTVTIVSDGTTFDWSSTLGIDAVIAKGGPNANVYYYDPESFGDDGLHTPINPNNGQPFAISHIEFCYDYEVEVEKDATTTFTRTFLWDIDKSVTPETLDMFTGDSASVQYTVDVTQTGFVDSDWAVSGNITIYNPDPNSAATITDVTDDVSGVPAVVDCPSDSVPSLSSIVCTYSTALPDGSNRTNTATVTTNEPVGGGSATADVIFGDPTTVVNDTVNVSDTYAGDLGSFNGSGQTGYSREFACDADEGEHGNTATIVETGQSDSASVTVNCYALEVTKDASTSFKTTWTWDIEKTGDQTDLVLSTGQIFTVNYTVEINATSADSDWAVEGDIDVYNPAPIDALINSVSDIVSPNIAATVECNVAFPYTLGAGLTLECSYETALPDSSDRTNTATATLQNHDDGVPSGTTDFSGSADVDFDDATINEVDECVDVNDDLYGFLGTVCADSSPFMHTFDVYSLDVGPYDVCGEYTFINVAAFETNDTGTEDSDDHTVNVVVPCEDGCTLTQGYWKTHSHHGPAPEDDAWFSLGDADGDGVSEGTDEMFFTSGQTWYEVLWTAPRGGNVYYILAHQYIAASLNIANGAATTPAVDSAISSAETFFNTYTPNSSFSKSVKNQAQGWATTLDKYNNGLIGPGHCSE